MSKKEQTITKIMQASLQEFASKGYEQASTNQIAIHADVSKGLIFKYFTNKKILFMSLFSQVLTEMMDEFYKVDIKDKDPFSKIIEIIYWKAMYAKTHEQQAKLLLDAMSDPPKEIILDIYSYVEELKVLSVHHFFDDIDYSKYAKRYTKEQVVRFIELAIEGLQASVLKKGLTIDKLLAIKEESIEFIKIVLKGMEDEHELCI